MLIILTAERVHAKSFLPGLLGTNAAFVPLPDVPLLVGDVIDLARLKAFKVLPLSQT